MSIIDSAKYDLNAICASGDIGLAVTYYQSDGLDVSTRVILADELSTSDDGMVIGSYKSAIIQKNDVSAPAAGDEFYDGTDFKTYKVLEILENNETFARAVVEAG